MQIDTFSMIASVSDRCSLWCFFVWIRFSELICWDDPCLKTKKKTKVKVEDTSPLSAIEPWSLLSLSGAERSSVAKMIALLELCILDLRDCLLYVKFRPDDKLHGLIRLHADPPLYHSPRDGLLSAGPIAGPSAPGPCRAQWSCMFV